MLAQELRLHLCPQSAGSQGMREFIKTAYLPARLNSKSPLSKIPILVRECKGVQARIFASMDKGVEKKVICENLSAKEIEKIFLSHAK